MLEIAKLLDPFGALNEFVYPKDAIMKKLVKFALIGCGKQGWNHLKCINKLSNKYDVQFVGAIDKNKSRLDLIKNYFRNSSINIEKTVFCDSLYGLSRKMDLSDVLVDVVTSNDHHFTAAKDATKKNAKGIVIEKPLAQNLKDALKFKKLDKPIYVTENYLFSKITAFAKEYIDTHKLTPIFLKTEFSKDRRLDSSQGRGLQNDYVPHVFSIEMPHQIALAGYLVGEPINVIDAWSHDMILPDGRIPSHGEGAITLCHENNITSYNFSCLQGYRHMPIAYRSMRIYCEDDIKIFCFYSTTMDLDGSVIVYKGNKLIEKHNFIDDSIKHTFEYILDCSLNDKKHINDSAFGCRVMEIIESAQELSSIFL
jgi:predicted dehydrogenase